MREFSYLPPDKTFMMLDYSGYAVGSAPHVVRAPDGNIAFTSREHGPAREFFETKRAEQCVGIILDALAAAGLVIAAAPAENSVKTLQEKLASARAFVERHPALSLIDLAEFEAFLKVPEGLDAAAPTEAKP